MVIRLPNCHPFCFEVRNFGWVRHWRRKPLFLCIGKGGPIECIRLWIYFPTTRAICFDLTIYTDPHYAPT